MLDPDAIAGPGTAAGSDNLPGCRGSVAVGTAVDLDSLAALGVVVDLDGIADPEMAADHETSDNLDLILDLDRIADLELTAVLDVVAFLQDMKSCAATS